MHVQTQIMHALKAILQAGVPMAAGRVFQEKVDPIPQAQLPALLFEESGEGEDVSDLQLDGTQERAYAIQIACAVAHKDNYGALARELGEQVELLLGSEQPAMQPLLDLCAGGIRIASPVRMAYSGEGEDAQAVRLQTWIFTYNAHQARPDIALN